jgi:hypothetical protein
VLVLVVVGRSDGRFEDEDDDEDEYDGTGMIF